MTTPVESTPLAARFFADNRALLSGETLELVDAAAETTRVVHLQDGSLALEQGGRVFASAASELALYDIVKRADEKSSFVVFGLGVGHTPRALRTLTRAPLVVFEPDPSIVRAFFESGPSDLGDIPIVCTSFDLTQIWPRISHGNKSATLVNTSGYPDLFPDQAKQLAETLGQLVQRGHVNDATHRLRARAWIQDVLANLDSLRENPSFLALAGQYRGVPAFIVGAGPSLAKNGKQLAEAAQKGLVIAVNSSARALASYGVEPQILACMESIDVSQLLAGLPFIDHVVRAFSLTAHPRTLKTGNGPLLPVFEGIPQLNGPLQDLLGVAGLPVSGSVSTLAFSLAQRLGCSPIVFVGQDLAYTDGKAYAPGSPYEASRVRMAKDGTHLEHDWCDTLKRTHNQGNNKMHEREPLRETLAWGGVGTVWSTIGFASVRAWLESAAIVVRRDAPEQRLLNATEGGARIEGFEEITLAELLASLPAAPISARDLSRAARLAAPPLPAERLRAWCLAQAELAETVRRSARRLRRLCDAAQGALMTSDPARISKSFDKLGRAESAFRAAVAGAPFVDAWAHAEIDSALEQQAADAHGDRERARSAVGLELKMAAVVERAASELRSELCRIAERMVDRTELTLSQD
ncbi:MAG TPA: 6-hydroxymethylpterin diphosphokinase MptE-like protein [Polyangiaceae bacterium]|jgi:hypothetical protein